MQLPDSVKAIRARYVAQYPVPTGDPGEAFEERARQWSIRFAEQVAFEQGPLWGMKRADNGRPISKDTITLYGDDALTIWDLLTGTGTGNPRLVDDPHGEEIRGQVFVKVTPVNHLGAAPPQPTTPQPPLADLVAVVAAMSNLTSDIDTLRRRVEDIAQSCGRIEAQQQATAENFAGLDRASELRHVAQMAVLKHLDEKEVRVTLPDGTLRIGGRAVGQVDFPN
jgi:hypothetical protein